MADDLADVYPYETDPDRHEFAWIFFNVPDMAKADLDTADRMARWVFDEMGCAPPGTVHAPTKKYDACGSSGAPWEPGEWIDADDDRKTVSVTVPELDVGSLTRDEREAYLAEVAAMVRAADDAERADTKRQRDETTEG